MIFVRDIQQAVAEHYGIPVGTMRETRGVRDKAHARQVAMYLSRKLVTRPRRNPEQREPISTPHIGALFGGRDHSTVAHAIRSVEQRRRGDAELSAAIDAISAELAEQDDLPRGYSVKGERKG